MPRRIEQKLTVCVTLTEIRALPFSRTALAKTPSAGYPDKNGPGSLALCPSKSKLRGSTQDRENKQRPKTKVPRPDYQILRRRSCHLLVVVIRFGDNHSRYATAYREKSLWRAGARIIVGTVCSAGRPHATALAFGICRTGSPCR